MDEVIIKNIKMVRGDTLAFNIEIIPSEEDETIYNLTSAYFSIKVNAEDTSYKVQKSLNNGITKVKDGVYKVRLAPSDTQSLDVGTYSYDLQIGYENDIKTLMMGSLTLKQDITREVS